MGQISFTEREKEILFQLSLGKSNRSIGLELKITESTVEFHLRNIFTKLQVSNRAEAIIWYLSRQNG